MVESGRRRRAGARPAAPAFPEPGELGDIRPREKPDRLAFRPAARTARPAVDAGRLHRIDKAPVAARITREHRFPEFVLDYVIASGELHSVVSGFGRTNHVHHHA